MAFDDDEEDDVPQQTEEDQRKSAADYAAVQERLRRKDPGWNMFNNTTPKYSAVYDEGGDKGEPDYPNAPIIQGLEPDYAATKQGAEYPFERPFGGKPILGITPEEAATEPGNDIPGFRPPPIRTFAGNTETTPQQGLGAAYQSLGPVAQEKYRYLMQHRQDILRGTYGPHQAAALTDISRQMADLIHVHEEGVAKGVAKAQATIGGQQAQQSQQAAQQPIFSDRQKQLIGQLQASEQEFKMMANRGEIGEDEIRKGVEYYQQAYKSIVPVGKAGLPFDPRFKPDQQPGMDWIDDKTSKHLTRDDKGNIVEMNNERIIPTLAHIAADKKHDMFTKTAQAYGTDPLTAVKIHQAYEMQEQGQEIPKGFLPDSIMAKMKGGAGEKKGPGEAPMAEEKFHAARDKAELHLGKKWDEDQAPATSTKPAGPKRLWNDREEYIHEELVKRGLARQDSPTGDVSYKGYLDSWNALHGEKGQKAAPGAPEAIGAPAQPAPAEAPQKAALVIADKLPGAAQKEAAAKTGFEGTILKAQELMKAHPKGIMDMTPQERWVVVQGLRSARKHDKSIPEKMTTDEYMQEINAQPPGAPAAGFRGAD